MPPKFVSCYLCGQQYSISSLPIHQQSCYKKRYAEWEQRPKNSRGQQPTHPSKVPNHGIINTTKTKNKENGLVASPVVGGLVPCSICGRSFNGDRIEKHQNACQKINDSNRTRFNSSKQRIKGTEIENTTKQQTSVQPEQSCVDWKEQRRDFLSNIRVAKKTQEFEHDFEVFVPTKAPNFSKTPEKAESQNNVCLQTSKRHPPPYSFINAKHADQRSSDCNETISNGLSTAPSVGSSASRSTSTPAILNRNKCQSNSPVKYQTPATNECKSQRPPATRRTELNQVEQIQRTQNHVPRRPVKENESSSHENFVNSRYTSHIEPRYSNSFQEELIIDEEEDQDFINSDPYTAKLYAEYLSCRRTRKSWQPDPRSCVNKEASVCYDYVYPTNTKRSSNRGQRTYDVEHQNRTYTSKRDLTYREDKVYKDVSSGLYRSKASYVAEKKDNFYDEYDNYDLQEECFERDRNYHPTNNSRNFYDDDTYPVRQRSSSMKKDPRNYRGSRREAQEGYVS